MYANVLRAGTLSDDRVIRRVSANFVPTHFNNNDPTRSPLDPSDILWKQILGQKDLQGQGIWVVAPNGTVIAGMSAEVDGHPSEKTGNGPASLTTVALSHQGRTALDAYTSTLRDLLEGL